MKSFFPTGFTNIVRNFVADKSDIVLSFLLPLTSAPLDPDLVSTGSHTGDYSGKACVQRVFPAFYHDPDRALSTL